MQWKLSMKPQKMMDELNKRNRMIELIQNLFPYACLLSGSLLLAGNGDLLASLCPGIALGVLPSAWKPHLVTLPSVALDVFQPLDSHLVEPSLRQQSNTISERMHSIRKNATIIEP